MSTISQTVLDKLRDDIIEVVSFWNTISNHRNLRNELSAADVVALINVAKAYGTLESSAEKENVPPVPYILPTNISTESLAYKKPVPDIPEYVAVEIPPIKKLKGKKKDE